MTPMFWTLALILLLPADDSGRPPTPRKPNPFAPSLPLLTPEEEKELDRIIDRFIQADIGQIKGDEAKEAVREFQKLGQETIPALIRGLNKGARIEASCPAVTIARKLLPYLRSTRDPELLEFARENIGAGVTESKHQGLLRDLRVTCMMRKRALVQSGITSVRTAPLPVKSQPKVTTSQLLAQAADLEPGPKRDQLVKELDRRSSGEVVSDLGAIAADDSNTKVQQLARELLDRQLSRLTPKALKEKLKDNLVEVRSAAARLVGKKGLHFERELIDLLADENSDLRQAARQALVKLNPRVDFGPEPDANDTERATAERKWRDWLAKQGGR